MPYSVNTIMANNFIPNLLEHSQKYPVLFFPSLSPPPLPILCFCNSVSYDIPFSQMNCESKDTKIAPRAATFYQSDEEDGKEAAMSMVVRPIFSLNDYKAY